MNLLLLEKGSDQGAIDEIFRSVHTLKGASASMGFYSDGTPLSRDGGCLFTCPKRDCCSFTELGNLLLACSDLIEQMLDEIESGGDSSSRNPDDLVAALRRWIEQIRRYTEKGEG